MGGHLPIGRKQGQGLRGLPLLIKGFNDPAPGGLLAVVNLAQVEHRPLDHAPLGAAPAFDDAPVAVLLTVFKAPVAFQVHGRPSF
jgi:hypothetical protein